jgi:hypothetical protein
MTERSLYAHATTLLLTACLLLAGRADAQTPVCGTCLGVAIEPGQVVLLPELLGGFTVLLRVHEGPNEALSAGIEDIRRRGGRPALLVPAPAPDDPAQVYRSKLRLTELRGALGPDVIIALDVSRGSMPGGQAMADLAGYVDVVVGEGPAPPGLPLWKVMPGLEVKAALEATRSGGADVWVMQAPGDVLETRNLVAEIARVASGPEEGFTEDVEVRAARSLTVEEIVARHQAQARRQAARLTHSIASGTMTLTFEAPGFPAPVTIASETIIYSAPDRTELEQRSIRVNGIEFRGSGIPRLPIIEPERVVSPPLAITLSDLYRYRLDGEETRDGVRCYVVAFTPIDPGAPLFSGRAWIAMKTFAMLRVAAAQTRLRGAIVSSDQIDDFREAAPGIWLLAQSDVRQIYEGPGHRTPIHRLLRLSTHEVNPSNFASRLQSAYASSSVMLRDTAAGYRYLKRAAPRVTESGQAVAIVPEVAARAASVRTLAAGVIIDPNISVPLPFAGLSYVNFDLFHTGTQLNAFFGGSYVQAAFSTPSVGGSRWQLAGRAFGIATSYNDRSFRDGAEIYDENLRQRPAHVSAWLLRPLTPRLSLRLGYELDYTRLQAAPETAQEFTVPADQVLHGARIALDGQRGGWAGSLWWNPALRTGWEPWGRPGDYDPSHRSPQRYGASLSRSMPLTSRAVARVEGAMMAGTRLDRFSRYAFGTFDNRLRGYPAALIRYDRGAVLRGAVAWPITRFARLDGFVDTAYVRDRGFGTAYRNYTGMGAAIETPAPFGLLTSVEWGYGFRGVNADGRRGTHVIRVSAFKVF